jgi:hypothetical protein
MPKAFSPIVTSANRLGDGRVVFLARDRAGWVEDFLSAGVWRTAGEAEVATSAAKAFEAANAVLDIAPVEVPPDERRLSATARLHAAHRHSLRHAVVAAAAQAGA